MFSKLTFSCLVGNVLDHFDTAVFAFLLPVITPLFFPDIEPGDLLFVGFSIFALASLSKPVGAVFFGMLAERFGARFVLTISLLGVAVTTFAVALLTPGGFWAGYSLILLRLLQGFFASGESSVASLTLLDLSPAKNRSMMSGIYQCSTMIGIILASLASLLVYKNIISWHVPFLLAPVTALYGLSLRLSLPACKPEKTGRLSVSKSARLFFVGCFSYLTYSIPFIFLPDYLNIVIGANRITLSASSFWVLVFDLLLFLPAIYVTKYVSARKLMLWGIGIFWFACIMLFNCIMHLELWQITILQSIMIVGGVTFVSPLANWIHQEHTSGRYITTSTGMALGSEFAGRFAPVVCIWLYQKTNITSAPLIYICVICLLSYIALCSHTQKFFTRQVTA